MNESQCQVIKRDGSLKPFNIQKITEAVKKAFNAVGKHEYPEVLSSEINNEFKSCLSGDTKQIAVESIQDCVERLMFECGFFDEVRAYIVYRQQHAESRLIQDKIKYVRHYAQSKENAASNSNTDANANNSVKNVASIDIEVFKDKIRLMQRQMMKEKLNEMFPEVAKQYEEDLGHHICYAHDESNSPIQKSYCGAYTLYPLMTEGVGNMDNVTPTPPNDIQSFSGQVTNLTFALSAQTKGAVALGDYIVALNYYVIQEFGEDWYKHTEAVVATPNVRNSEKCTIAREVKKGMKQFVFGVNQPAGNRGFQSPFTNINIFDKYYFESMFGEFCYPDGTKPEWAAVDCLQRMFVELLRTLRLIKPLTFPVVTFALLYDDNGYKDKDYEQFCAQEWALGSSHFLYHSNNADSLASCCRVSNKISENTFSSTTGMTGIMTGSCNVITLNINRIVQDWWLSRNCKQEFGSDFFVGELIECTENNVQMKALVQDSLGDYLRKILDRVYKYHIAYKTMLYELEEEGMITYCNAGYLYIKKLFSTIGVLGYYEAAKFFGYDDHSEGYKEFIAFVMKTISDYNKKNSIYDQKRPFIFNLEAIPGENLAVKLYNWDKADGYEVPADQNLYNCYFFNPWKEESILHKIRMHGGEISKASDGGQGCHLNLAEHLSKEQYLKVMNIARIEGCNYFTFNIPMSECKHCHHIVNAPIQECPICHSHEITYYTRVIGFLTAVSNWSKERQLEFKKRYFGNESKL